MNSDSTNHREIEASNDLGVKIPTSLLLSLATAPLLVGVLCGKASIKFLQALGEASEEVFRGDRLPVLRFPTVQTKGD